LATRVSYAVEIKMRAIEMRLANIPVKEIMDQLNIRNETQLKTWMRWYRAGDLHRLEQPMGQRQQSLNKPFETTSPPIIQFVFKRN
jgi:transposase-like protein